MLSKAQLEEARVAFAILVRAPDSFYKQFSGSITRNSGGEKRCGGITVKLAGTGIYYHVLGESAHHDWPSEWDPTHTLSPHRDDPFSNSLLYFAEKDNPSVSQDIWGISWYKQLRKLYNLLTGG